MIQPISAYELENNESLTIEPQAAVQKKLFSKEKTFTVSGTDESGNSVQTKVTVTVSGNYSHTNGTDIKDVVYDVVYSISDTSIKTFAVIIAKSYTINTSSVTITVNFKYSFDKVNYKTEKLTFEV